MNTDTQMDAIEIIEADHKVVAALMDKIANTTERAEVTREELFAKLKLNLDAHAEMEEQAFYPAIEEAKETHKITLEAFEEHAVVKDLLAQLAAEDHNTEEWTAKFTVLKENVEHHVKEEEEDLLPKSRKILGKDKLMELAPRMLAVKEKFLNKNS